MWKEIFTINWHAAIDVVWFCQQQRITTSRLCINPNIFLAWLHSQNHSPHDWNYGKWASELALSPCYFACGRISLCRSTQTQCAHTFFIYIIITIIIMMAASRSTYNIIFSMLLSAVILPIAFLLLLFGWFGLIRLLPMHSTRSFIRPVRWLSLIF